jgi:hypothetical protein
MHPQLSAALERLDSATRDLHEVAAAIPGALHARRPSADRWSINEVLEHISIVEQLFVGSLIHSIGTAKNAGLAGEVDQPEMLSEQLQMTVEDRGVPRTAPERAQPTGTIDATAALTAIAEQHARLRGALASVAGLRVSAVAMEHRAFGMLNVYQWVDLIAGHERRHLAQIRETAARLAAV